MRFSISSSACAREYPYFCWSMPTKTSKRPAALSRSSSVSSPHQPLASARTCVHLPTNTYLSTDPPWIIQKSCPNLRRRSGQHSAPDSSLLLSQVASSRTNARGNRPQALRHTLGRFPFTDKRIRARREGGLLTGVQMADKNNDQRSRTS